jgi:uncharacterized protein YicC (UPF0701 family)
VLRWPGVIEDPPLERDALLAESLALLEDALATLDEMRRAEGARLAETLASRTDDVARIAAAVRARRPEVLSGIEQKLRERLERLDVETEPGRPSSPRRWTWRRSSTGSTATSRSSAARSNATSRWAGGWTS